ncbi:hypothetical protein [uncultured Serinicoccus sp.]|uniref:hypothetical protein n=1 Tax=uncultured Serinicoccus sp. TaxID=735514 RepID=UPI002611FC78|nr:hypothetical protein [uncultured Serinicoccus sp.]
MDLAAAYTLRAVADGSTDETVRELAWASPVQWMALARPYADERWWVLVLPAVTALALLALAVGLERRRDHGSGLWAARRGRAEAVASLATPGALVRRLQRGQVIGWTIGLLLFALAMGSLSTAFDDMLEQVPQLRLIFQRMGGGAEQLVDAFFVALLAIIAVLIAVVAVQLFSRLAAEEERGHAELVLSTGATRGRLLGAYLLVAALAPALMLVAVGAVMALNQARATGDWGIVAEVAGAGAALAPGGLLVLGIAVLLHGWAPRLAWITWVVVAWSLVMVWVGPALDLPEWLTELTPWSPLPQLPVEDMDWPVVLGMTGLAALLLGLGAVGYRRRDITGT